jgi:Spy/CpxP family protein refolding chaperone
MSMKSRTWISLLLLLAAMPAGPAWAQPEPPDLGPGVWASEGGSEDRLERLATRLDLTDAQKTQIEGIWKQGEAERTSLRKQSMRLSNEMRGEMLKDEVDEAKVLKLGEQISDVRAKMSAQRLKQRLAVRKVLTPEQRDKWLTMQSAGRHRLPSTLGRHGRGGR